MTCQLDPTKIYENRKNLKKKSALKKNIAAYTEERSSEGENPGDPRVM